MISQKPPGINEGRPKFVIKLARNTLLVLPGTEVMVDNCVVFEVIEFSRR